MRREPALIIAAIMSVIFAATEFGLDLTETQMSAVGAALVALGALWTRSKVTPTG